MINHLQMVSVKLHNGLTDILYRKIKLHSFPKSLKSVIGRKFNFNSPMSCSGKSNQYERNLESKMVFN
jgi:hypothetical protein